jgi:glycosyltransferase involved in cell wall biosynthesis
MKRAEPDNDWTVVVVTNLARGGAQQVALTFARHLSAAGKLLQMLLLDPTQRSLSSIKVNQVSGIFGLFGHKLLYPLCIPALAIRFRRLRPQVVLSTLLIANLVSLTAARLALGRHPLCVIRETTTIGARLAQSGLSGHVRLTLARWIYPLADIIIAPSQGVANDLVKIIGLPHEKVHILHNPTIDAEFEDRSREDVSHKFFSGSSAPVYIACGRLGPEKGYDTLLNAFGRVAEKHPNARLIIMGEGQLRRELENLASTLGVSAAVDFAGYVANPLPLIRRSDVFVLPSRWEGLPNALIQALGCGTTPVATDCPSGPSEILENGRFGLLVPVDDAKALAEAMVRAWHSPLPKEKLKLRAQDFSEDRIFGQYEALVEAALRKRG